MQVLGVEDRDHDDRADVVDDRQRQQEQLEPPDGIRRPSRPSTPTANGDVGGHRDAPARRRRRRRRRSGGRARPGTSIPPIAATIGSAAVRGSRRSPATSSYLISSPTTKKKITISASLTQCWRDSSIRSAARGRGRSVRVPERVVRRRPRAVGPHQRDGRGEEQQDRAGGLDRGGTRAPVARPGARAACCSPGRTDRRPRRRRRRSRVAVRVRSAWGAASRGSTGHWTLRHPEARADQTSRHTCSHPSRWRVARRAALCRVDGVSTRVVPCEGLHMAHVAEPTGMSRTPIPRSASLVIDASRDISTLISKEIAARQVRAQGQRQARRDRHRPLRRRRLPRPARDHHAVGRDRLLHAHDRARPAWCFLIVFGVYVADRRPARLHRLKQVKQVKAPERAIEQAKRDPQALKGKG